MFKADKLLVLIIFISCLLIFHMVWNYFQVSEEDQVLVEYASKPKVNENVRVVVSLWVDEKNYSKLDTTLLSLMKQSHRVDMIYINVAPNMPLLMSKLADKCAIVQKAGKVYDLNERPTMTILREKENGIFILEIEVGPEYHPTYIGSAMHGAMRTENYVYFPKLFPNEMDPNKPGTLNMLLSHNLDV